MTLFATRRAALALAAALSVGAIHVADAQTPPPASPRVDAIKKAGALRVGVLANPPWLTENTRNPQQPWGGPAWTLAVEAANRMGVKVQPIAVSHETKVPVLATNQVDISITALAEKLRTFRFSSSMVTALGLRSAQSARRATCLLDALGRRRPA